MREPTAPAYYDHRAPEYDDWYLGVGLFAERDRAGFDDDLTATCAVLSELDPASTLDVACGTGFLTRHLHGEITGLDQSARMLEVAAARLPHHAQRLRSISPAIGSLSSPTIGVGEWSRHPRAMCCTCR